MDNRDLKQAKRFILNGLRKQENNKKDIFSIEFFINLSGLMRIILSKPLECRNCLDWICNTLEYCPYKKLSCNNCFHGFEGICYNVYGIEKQCSEISNNFYCKNHKIIGVD